MSKKIPWNKGKKVGEISWEQREALGWGKILSCPNCEKIFYRQKNQIKEGSMQLCSRECYAEHRKGMKLYGWEYHVCTSCGNEFPRHKYLGKVKKVIGQFCNTECYSKWKSTNGNTPRTGKTIPEKKVESILDHLNVEYVYNKNFFSDEFGNCYYDFYIPDKNLVIEVDGNYWHGNPKFYPKLNEQQEKVKLRDFDKELNLKNKKVILERIWESDITLVSLVNILNKY